MLRKLLVVAALAVAFLVILAGPALAQGTGDSGEVFTAIGVAIAGLLAFVATPAALVTKAVDLVRAFDKQDTWPKALWIALAFVFGVAVALVFLLNAVGPVLEALPRFSDKTLSPTAGQVLTGLAIGGVASGLHELFDKWSSAAKESRAIASRQ